MDLLCIWFMILVCQIIHIASIKVTFISWNVNDNKKFDAYNEELISTVLKIKATKELPDLYAITFQENCIDCRDSNLPKIAKPFIETLQKTRSESYELVSIHDTRDSNKCELIYCVSQANMHGTSFIMVLAKTGLKISETFKEKNNDCSSGLISNREKGIAVIGFTLSNKKLCFGGLHLDANVEASRKKCFVDLLDKVKKKCDVMFFGGDFNVRPRPKSEPAPVEFTGVKDESFFEKLKITDEFSGLKPHSSEKNFLDYVQQNKQLTFMEPFGMAPKFPPTYSIKSVLNCKEFPVCYNPKRYPAWTDRVIIYPQTMVKCSEYSSLPELAALSDHIPVFATCEVTL